MKQQLRPLFWIEALVGFVGPAFIVLILVGAAGAVMLLRLFLLHAASGEP